MQNSISDPSATGGPYANGISGNDIVGQLYDGGQYPVGFLYDGTTYTLLNDPVAAEGSYASGISDGNIVGTYYDINGDPNGFLAEGVPEPSCVVLILTGIAALAVVRSPIVRGRNQA